MRPTRPHTNDSASFLLKDLANRLRKPLMLSSQQRIVGELSHVPRHYSLKERQQRKPWLRQPKHSVALDCLANYTIGLPDSSERSPLVSFIIPAYNAEAFIAQTLTSVIAQTYQNLEILVVNDGSTDNTEAIVEQFALQDCRIRCLKQENAGVAAARNFGIQHAQGEYIAPIDADDIWYPDATSKLVKKLMSCSSKVGLVYAWSLDIDENNQFTGGFHAAKISGTVYKTLICHNFLGNASSTLIRKSCFDTVGGYSTQFRLQKAQGCEDWDLYLRMAEKHEFDFVPEFLVNYRKLEKSMSGDFQQMARSQDLMLRTIQDNHSEIPDFIYRMSRSSFYLYFAHQCSQAKLPQMALAWLWSTIKVDQITPLFRLGFYTLLSLSVYTTAIESVLKSSRQEKENSICCSNEIVNSNLDTLCTGKAVLKSTSLKVYLKVFVGQFLHYSLSRV